MALEGGGPEVVALGVVAPEVVDLGVVVAIEVAGWEVVGPVGEVAEWEGGVAEWEGGVADRVEVAGRGVRFAGRGAGLVGEAPVPAAAVWRRLDPLLSHLQAFLPGLQSDPSSLGRRLDRLKSRTHRVVLAPCV